MRLWLAAFLAAVCVHGPASAQLEGMQPVAGDPVRTAGGPVAGTRLASGVRAYFGIPFARPPVGALRWAPPQPVSWRGVWNADRRGPECIQVLRPHRINHYFGEEPSSEDCLYLNVWTPAAPATAGEAGATGVLPVVVFIYGGAFTIGSSGMANYDGEAVARAGAVFVNFNYRVGAFGFLAHPELTREQGGHSGNYGLLDQNAALRWVHDNIARFGGDPDRVVLVGQSAGAASIAAHIFSPSSRGLFRGAVMLSGCNYTSDGIPLAEAEQVGVELQQRLGAADLDALRQIPADRILALQTESQLGLRVEGVRIPGPIVDGAFLTRRKADAIAAGELARVPIVAAWTGDDIDVAMSPLAAATTVDQFRDLAVQLYGVDAAQFLRLYPVGADAEVPAVARRAAREAGFEAGARRCAEVQAGLGVPSWIAEFTRRHSYSPGVRIADQDPATVGAYHTADVPFWLGTLDKYNLIRPTRAWTEWDRTLAGRMTAMLVSFAATGRPQAPGVDWPAWAPRAERKLVLGDTIGVASMRAEALAWHARHPLPTVFDARSRRPRD